MSLREAMHCICPNDKTPVTFSEGCIFTLCSSCGGILSRAGRTGDMEFDRKIYKAFDRLNAGNLLAAEIAFVDLINERPDLYHGMFGRFLIYTMSFTSENPDPETACAYMNEIKKTAPEEEYEIIYNAYVNFIDDICLRKADRENCYFKAKYNYVMAVANEISRHFYDKRRPLKEKKKEAVAEKEKQRNQIQANGDREINRQIKKVVNWILTLILISAFLFYMGVHFSNTFFVILGGMFTAGIVIATAYGIMRVKHVLYVQDELYKSAEEAINDVRNFYDEEMEELGRAENEIRSVFEDIAEVFKDDECCDKSAIFKHFKHQYLGFDGRFPDVVGYEERISKINEYGNYDFEGEMNRRISEYESRTA